MLAVIVVMDGGGRRDGGILSTSSNVGDRDAGSGDS